MKKRIAFGASLLFVFGAAVGATLIYTQEQAQSGLNYEQSIASPTAVEPTPELIAAWKASATNTGYIAPKVPI